MTRIPEGSFEYYVSLGESRSYQKVADHFGVTKRGIVKRAVREDWSGRLARIEAEARERFNALLCEAAEEARQRHLTTLKAMSMRVLEGLKRHPLDSCMDAIRAAEITIKLERLLLGEATDRTSLQLETTIRREYDRWLKRDEEWEEAVLAEAEDEPLAIGAGDEAP